MARNGSGTYNRAVSPYTAGTTITAATVNSEMDDIATALTGSMARDGQSPATANIPMGGFRITGLANAVANTDAAALGQITAAQAGAVAKAGDTMTGALNYAPEVDLASATTTDIGAQTSNNVRITGTTTITSLGTAANGVTRQLRFAGALTLTHNATSLILPFGANILTTAGDTCTAKSLGSGDWVVTDFMFANIWRGAPVVLAEAVASNSATLDITGVFSDAYDRYELEILSLVPQNNDVSLTLRVGTGAGPTWQAGAAAYETQATWSTNADHAFLGGFGSGLFLTGTGANNRAGNQTGASLSGVVEFCNPDGSIVPTFSFRVRYLRPTGNGGASVRGGGYYGVTGAITGLRVLFSSGSNITSGSIRLLGYRK